MEETRSFRPKKSEKPCPALLLGVVASSETTIPPLDDAALIAALRTGQVAAAGLDVYEGEPKLNPAYFDLENVVLLPHLGSATSVTRDAMGAMVLNGIDAVLAGREPPNLVR